MDAGADAIRAGDTLALHVLADPDLVHEEHGRLVGVHQDRTACETHNLALVKGHDDLVHAGGEKREGPCRINRIVEGPGSDAIQDKGILWTKVANSDWLP